MERSEINRQNVCLLQKKTKKKRTPNNNYSVCTSLRRLSKNWFSKKRNVLFYRIFFCSAALEDGGLSLILSRVITKTLNIGMCCYSCKTFRNKGSAKSKMSSEINKVSQKLFIIQSWRYKTIAIKKCHKTTRFVSCFQFLYIFARAY